MFELYYFKSLDGFKLSMTYFLEKFNLAMFIWF